MYNTKEDIDRFEEGYKKIYPSRVYDVRFEKLDEDEFCYKLLEIHELFIFFLAGYTANQQDKGISK